MTHRIISKDEITRSKISGVAAMVALLAKQEDGSYKSKMSEVDDLIEDLYKHDLTFEPEDHVALMRSVVMGTLHASHAATAGFEGTASIGSIIGRMGSSHRPSHKDPSSAIYMIESVTDAVIVEVKRSGGVVEPVLRHQLKSDLSSALIDFRLLRKEGAERAAAYSLFGTEELEPTDEVIHG